MNPFAQLAATLTGRNVAAWNVEEVQPKGLSRTETIRRILKSASRPLTAAEIAFDMEHFADFGSHLVWLLLKYDMQKGRVILEDGKYRWNHEYDEAEALEIRNAVKLLKRHGYKVKEPA
jgi:hypothetical protein